MRLQAFLAACGAGSRRRCEDLIRAGRVTVDGGPPAALGAVVDPERQTVRLDGRPLRPEAKVYLLLNKPRGVLSTSRDPQGRPIALDLVSGRRERLYTVGRLDRDSEGLLLLTNDGAFAHALTHPRHHVAKTYLVWADGMLSPAQAARARAGVRSDGETLRVLAVERPAAADGPHRVVLGEGRKRHLRRLFAVMGLSVRRLQRVAIGPLTLGGLPPGRHRPLRPDEVEGLRAAAGIAVSRSGSG